MCCQKTLLAVDLHKAVDILGRIKEEDLNAKLI